MTKPSTLRVGLVALCAAGLVAAAGAAQASAAPSACQLVRPSEYRAVLHHSVRLSTGDGSTSCQVGVGGRVGGIIPNINPYNASYIAHMLALTTGKVRQPSLGPVGWSVVFPGEGPTVYAANTGSSWRSSWRAISRRWRRW
jgi:hypothetical protein